MISRRPSGLDLVFWFRNEVHGNERAIFNVVSLQSSPCLQYLTTRASSGFLRLPGGPQITAPCSELNSGSGLDTSAGHDPRGALRHNFIYLHQPRQSCTHRASAAGDSKAQG